MKVKYYYENGDKVWFKTKKVPAIITEIDSENKTAVVKYRKKGEEKEEKVNLWDVRGFREKDIVYFAKVRPEAIMPMKRKEDAGYDLYYCGNEDLVIQPREIKLVPTGIASAMPIKYRLKIRERSSSGTHGMAVRSGVVDSGYRDEIFVALQNNNDVPLEITGSIKTIEVTEDFIRWPKSKAIAQAVLEITPNVNVRETNYGELKNMSSQRGLGKLGSSGK